MVRCWRGKIVLGLIGASCVVGPSAHADRVLTDYEASKLTFSALIAPPSHYRHSNSKKHTAMGTMRLARGHRTTSVRNVAYHGRVVSPHRRNTHHRRG